MNWIVYIGILLSNVIGLVIFLLGFFPSKVVLPGHSDFFVDPSPFQSSSGKPQFNKFVLMVVDAMRADFLYSERYSNMTFVHELISEGVAIPYTAFSNPPTVTLPRLKGITTGGTPSFIDAILNVADDKDGSQGLSSQDSWVKQFRFKEGGKKINFYGDDTWLKLFPKDEFFDEVDGTNSFFVSDYTEVDNNVTRHLDDQLASSPSKWDGLILHYLGLDHIGHKGGPNSIFMPAKHREMDSVIQRIYNYIISNEEQKDDTLFIIMGDHGMNEVGNHGGSTEGETNAGLLFVSPKFKRFHDNNRNTAPVKNSDNYSYFNCIQQIDLVPTLAAFLNFPIPKNNLGVVVKESLLLWDEGDRNDILMENCIQFKGLIEAKYGVKLMDNDSSSTIENDDVIFLTEKWKKITNYNVDTETLYDFLYSAQDILSSSATSYNYEKIRNGYAFIILSAISAVTYFGWYFLRNSSCSSFLPFGFLLFTFSYSSNYFGSSFIEEEHQIWWFFTMISVLAVVNYFKFSSIFLFIILGSIRVIRTFSNSGQKFKTPYTLGYFLINHTDLLWITNILTYFVIGILIYGQGNMVHCFSFQSYVSFRNRDANDFGPLLSFVGIFVTISLSFLFKLLQFFNDGMTIPSWLYWLVEWNCDSFGIKDIASTDKKLFQGVITQLSRLFSFSLGGLFILRLTVGKVRGIRTAMLTDLSNIMTVFLIHQSRVELIPTFIFFFLIRFSIAKIILQSKLYNLDTQILVLSFFSLCLQNLSFFSMGNTNLLATVDLSNAYNGIASYDILLVGFLTFVSSFVGPIFWSVTLITWILESNYQSFDISKTLQFNRHLKFNVLKVKCLISLTFYSVCAAFLIGSCINLRFHLFIWTVFSPKLLFFAAWSVLMNCLVDFILIGLLVVFQ